MPKIVIYTTPFCVYCKMAKEFFAEHNVSYEEKDVSDDLTAREEMINKSSQMGVPVIEVDENIIVGFDKKVLSEMLNIK